jgi:hypothetical protein
MMRRDGGHQPTLSGRISYDCTKKQSRSASITQSVRGAPTTHRSGSVATSGRPPSFIRMSAIRSGGQRATGAGIDPGQQPRKERQIDCDSRWELVIATASAGIAERARHHDHQGVCATARSLPSFSAARFDGRKWRRSRSRASSSAPAGGASSISSKTRARPDRADAGVG